MKTTALDPLAPEFDAIDPRAATNTWLGHFWGGARQCQCAACRFSRDRITGNPEPPPAPDPPYEGPGCPVCGPEVEVETFTIDSVPGYGAGPTITRCMECNLDIRTE